MNFDFGEVLTRAGQITWRYKSLWLAGILISLIGFLSAPISLMFGPSFAALSDPSEVNRQLPTILLVNGLVIFLSILSIPLYVIGATIPALGTLRVERGGEKLNFGELIRGSLPYFWRILGVFLLVWVGMFLVVFIFMGCIIVLSAVTFGLASVCAFPMFLLFIPLMILVYALTEQGMAAVVVDDLSLSNALQRAWELVRKNIGVMALMSIIIYLGTVIVSMIVSIPILIPMFGFMTDVIQSAGAEPDMQSMERMFRTMSWWMLALSPFYAIFQGILLAFMQSAWTLTYLRLTKSQDNNVPVIVEANA
jgi:hypothetical protein